MRGPRGQSGSSLAEILISLFISSVGVLAIAPLFVTAVRGTAAGADRGVAAALAVARMETLRELPYESLTPGGNLSANVPGYFDTSNPDFTVRWQITNAVGTVKAKQITLRAMPLRPLPGASRDVTLYTTRSP